MILGEQVYAQALLLAGDLDERQARLLEVLCSAATASLTSRLRDGITPEDCKADFIAAASLYALAALGEADDQSRMEEFRAGDLTVRQSGEHRDAASRCLQRQADMMILPYLKDRFSFLGV
jgi:hypothetical protein